MGRTTAHDDPIAVLTDLLRMTLEIGPIAVTGEYTDRELALAWQRFGPQIMSEWEFRNCYRPWGWWEYEVGGHPPLQPGATEVRLAELGQLTDQEREEIADRAARAQEIIDSGRPRGYLATGGGKRLDFEQEAVELYERVREKQQAAASN